MQHDNMYIHTEWKRKIYTLCRSPVYLPSHYCVYGVVLLASDSCMCILPIKLKQELSEN